MKAGFRSQNRMLLVTIAVSLLWAPGLSTGLEVVQGPQNPGQPPATNAGPLKSPHVVKWAIGATFDAKNEITDPRPSPVQLPAGTTEFSLQLVVAPTAQAVRIELKGIEDQGGVEVLNHNKYTLVDGRPFQNQYGASFTRADGKPFSPGDYAFVISINDAPPEKLTFSITRK